MGYTSEYAQKALDKSAGDPDKKKKRQEKKKKAAKVTSKSGVKKVKIGRKESKEIAKDLNNRKLKKVITARQVRKKGVKVSI